MVNMVLWACSCSGVLIKIHLIRDQSGNDILSVRSGYGYTQRRERTWLWLIAKSVFFV